MKKSLFFSSAMALLLFTGCVSADTMGIKVSEPVDIMPESAPCAMKSARPAANAQMNASYDAVSNGNFNAPSGRKMAFTSDISITVPDVKKAITETRQLTLSSGGYIKTLNNNMLTLAIPVAKGDDFLNTLGKMGEVVNLRIEGSDVT